MTEQQYADCPKVYFAPDFLRDPPSGFHVEWTDGVTDGGTCQMVRSGKICHESCMKGVLVKLSDPQRVWRLTGNADTYQEGPCVRLRGYEAVWPD
jgi:hypothetical protein